MIRVYGIINYKSCRQRVLLCGNVDIKRISVRAAFGAQVERGCAMKYGILLTGRNKVIRDEFFTHLWDIFECLSCSGHSEDIYNHLKYYTPDAIVYCLYEESSDNFKRMVSVMERPKAARIPLVIVGTKEDCDAFNRFSDRTAQLVLERPSSIRTAGERLAAFLDEWKNQDGESAAVEGYTAQPDEDAAAPARTEEPPAAAGAPSPAPETHERKRVLVVDDDTLMLKLIKEQLHGEYDVATAISGKIAFKFLENKHADLILLDYKMPGEDGPAVLEKLRANEATKDIPVLFLTGITDSEKIMKAIVLKPQGYLLKPIDRKLLLDSIRKYIG